MFRRVPEIASKSAYIGIIPSSQKRQEKKIPIS
jgi:hypothetical protein